MSGLEAAPVDSGRRLQPHVAPLAAAQYADWADYRLPVVQRHPGDIWSIPLPISADGRNFVYAYLLTSDDGLVLVDTGLDSPSALPRLIEAIAAIGFELSDLRTVLVTHYHRDHYGNATELKRLTGARLGLHAIDAEVLRFLREAHPEHRAEQHRLWAMMDLHAVPEVDALRAGNPYADAAPADPDFFLLDGALAPVAGRRLRVIWTPGHSPGHVCLLEETQRALFAGDLVLPRITPGVSMQAVQRANPLSDFIHSLETLRKLDVVAVFPGHEYAFTDLPGRLAEIDAHHRQRMAELLRALSGQPEQTAHELASRIGWSRPWTAMDGRIARMATSETMAHLVFLAERGDVLRKGFRPARWSLAARAPL